MFRNLLFVGVLFSFLSNARTGTSQPIPPALNEWKEWVLFGNEKAFAPRPYNDVSKTISIWPSRLKLDTDASSGSWEVAVQLFAEDWVPLPGDDQTWPQAVQSDGKDLPVVEKNGKPSVRLPSGVHPLKGQFKWSEAPQKIAVPSTYGIVELTVSGQSIAVPNRDEQGYLWLKRQSATEDDQDDLTVQVYRVIEDGLPMWLRTRVDLTVSGKSREETIGNVLPEGWSLSSVSGPIPIAIDEQGKLKVQVRAGTWQLRIEAFRNRDLQEWKYADELAPAVATELVAIRAAPELRTIEFQGSIPVDAQMTTFPQEWRNLPLYEWKTNSTLKWIEKSRGMGGDNSSKIALNRWLWLGDDGKSITFQDKMKGRPKKISRLDISTDHQLGVVRIDGERQLITENPTTKNQGVELRYSQPNLEAIGTTTLHGELSAGGWETDVDRLNLNFILPPGWRALAVFGADDVDGDWLTAWTLMDLFLLLVFAVAAYRLWGGAAGILAFIAFGLSYHEMGAPRLTWLFLLFPTAILHVVKQGRVVAWLQAWRWLALAMLLFNLIPFAVIQIQNGLFPQLERTGVPYGARKAFEWFDATYNESAAISYSGSLSDDLFGNVPIQGGMGGVPAEAMQGRSNELDSRMVQSKFSSDVLLQKSMANMQLDPASSVQTGVAKPAWYGTEIRCRWDGPVTSDQTIRPLFLSNFQHRCLNVVRLVLLAALTGVFVGIRSFGRFQIGKASVAKFIIALLLVACTPATNSLAQWPNEELLKQLRDRQLPNLEAFPRAAEIASMELRIVDGKMSIQAEVHAAADTAIPVPGRFPSWSPLKVELDDKPAVVCRREDGHLWVSTTRGLHRLSVEGLLGERGEWVWAVPLQPRHLQIDAPEWNVVGLDSEGRPEGQLFFTRKEHKGDDEVGYDQRNFRAVALVERKLEIGLLWKIHNTVRRLSAPGKAFSFQVPLLQGERVVSTGAVEKNGSLEVNLAGDAQEFSWESELSPVEKLTLQAVEHPSYVQRWSLLLSPVWNAEFEGLEPIYVAVQSDLIPTWYPWPGEQVSIQFRRPTAVAGKLLTIQNADHHWRLGRRQRNSSLRLQVESSLGGDFPIGLPEGARVEKLSLDGRDLPIRKEATGYIISLQPGEQTVECEWTTDQPIGFREVFPLVKLPTDSANITSQVDVPDSRWILWADGPIRGPAVRFWVVLIASLLIAIALGRLRSSPLRGYEWLLLALGLTQINVVASCFVVGWLFLLMWRGKRAPHDFQPIWFNCLQIGIVIATIAALIILLVIVGQGLLGSPEMFILGNGSYDNQLNWFEPQSSLELPRPNVISVSVWFYRLLMLAWALWLANALVRWLQAGWMSFTRGGAWLKLEEPKPSEPAKNP
jgi:hypothetical protein